MENFITIKGSDVNDINRELIDLNSSLITLIDKKVDIVNKQFQDYILEQNYKEFYNHWRKQNIYSDQEIKKMWDKKITSKGV